MRKLIILFSLLAAAYPSFGNTITAASGGAASVQSAVNSANNGDTVIIPNGKYNWTSAVTVSKFIKLEAATLGGVTVTHNHPGGDLIDLTTSSAGHSVIAGINFLPGTANSSSDYIYVRDGTNPQFAILHDCTFNLPNFQLLRAVDWLSTGGLIYNCTFTSTDDGGSGGPGSLSLIHI